jgi:hypothetical protein
VNSTTFGDSAFASNALNSTYLSATSAASGAGLTLAVAGGGTNESLTAALKGTGQLVLSNSGYNASAPLLVRSGSLNGGIDFSSGGIFFITSGTAQASVSTSGLIIKSSIQYGHTSGNADAGAIDTGWARFAGGEAGAAFDAFHFILPGAGQAYNRKYWKLPLVYGGVVGFYYWISYNHKFYIQFRDLYLEGLLSSKNLQNLDPVTARAKDLQNFYRRTRDLAIILSGVFYLLTIVDAYADAHFRSFDITEDLSLYIKPSIQPTLLPNQWGSGLTFSLKFK